MSTQTLTNLQIRWQITAHSLAFILGISVVFIALGFSAGLVSNFLFDYGNTVRIVAGVFLVFLGIVMLRILPIPFLQREFRLHMARKPGGYFGSAVVGVAFGAGWTPCIGPILGGILAIASTSGSAAQGGLLLAFYALGFALPFLLAAQTLTAWRKLNKYAGIIEKMGGIMLILVGIVLLFNLTAYLFSLFPQISQISLENQLSFSEESQLSFAIAFIAGALSFLSPCVLPILPSFLAYLTGVNAEQLSQVTLK